MGVVSLGSRLHKIYVVLMTVCIEFILSIGTGGGLQFAECEMWTHTNRPLNSDLEENSIMVGASRCRYATANVDLDAECTVLSANHILVPDH